MGAQRGAKLFKLVGGHGSKLAFFDALVEPHKNAVAAHFAAFGGASVLASRLVSSLAPPICTTTKNAIVLDAGGFFDWIVPL
jgi:hypothetical protein